MPIDNPEVLIYFAYQDWNPYAAENIGYINELERTVASVLGLSGNKVIDENIINREVIRKGLDNYVNHSLDYVLGKAKEYDLDILVIGDGDTVISQYPSVGSTIITGQRVMVLTNSRFILMPNMKGYRNSYWFWNMTVLHLVRLCYVKTQNFAEGTQIDKTMTIEVQLQ